MGDRNLMKFNREKCKVLKLGETTPGTRRHPGGNQLGRKGSFQWHPVTEQEARGTN